MRNYLVACCVVILIICGGEVKVQQLSAPGFKAQGIELSANGVLSASIKK